MNIAQRDLGIPAVLEPEYLASPWLDELSGMTYLSYFMKPGSPGFHATLRWVNSRLERSVNNFTVRFFLELRLLGINDNIIYAFRVIGTMGRWWAKWYALWEARHRPLKNWGVSNNTGRVTSLRLWRRGSVWVSSVLLVKNLPERLIFLSYFVICVNNCLKNC